jgi:hypothetical protein
MLALLLGGGKPAALVLPGLLPGRGGKSAVPCRLAVPVGAMLVLLVVLASNGFALAGLRGSNAIEGLDAALAELLIVPGMPGFVLAPGQPPFVVVPG